MMRGKTLRDAMLSAANNIQAQRQAVDALNVFPVPDGDTGTNMSMTIGNGVRELQGLQDDAPIGQVAQVAASALLRGARGNSGVILSLLFRGFAKGLKDKAEAGPADFALALESGVHSAYKAVMKPTEGTILTVARMASVKARQLADSGCGMEEFWQGVLDEAKDALEKTPEQLPVLKKAGVVDAGGRGFVVILEGMISVFLHGVMVQGESAGSAPEPAVAQEYNASGEYEAEITFPYCTEFIVMKENGRDPLLLRAFLESRGDSVVVVDDEDIIKVHVHTDNPGDALQEGLKFGSLTKIKIENMREQHENRKAMNQPQKAGEEFAYAPVDPQREIGFVAVAAGDGVRELFLDLGVDQVVSGGQTMNPSTDDILCAVQSVPAKYVFVLPNNKNIIMAAEQAGRLADREVCVLQSRTIPQGMAAMLAFEQEEGPERNSTLMTQAMEKVETGLITFAARDSDFDGHSIKKGELLALDGGKLLFTDTNIEKTLIKLTRSLMDKDTGFVTVLYGEDIEEDRAAQLESALREKLPDDVELSFLSGGQPVYYFIISVE